MDSFYAIEAHRTKLQKTMGFSDLQTVNTWIDSAGVKPFKDEFIRDYLANHQTDPDADYQKVTNLLGVNQIMNFTSYGNSSSLDKTGWSKEKHWVRFVSQMGLYAKEHLTAWKAPREDDMEMWFWHGYEVVRFLKAEYANDHAMENGA